MKAIIALVVFASFLFYLPALKPVFAVTVKITNYPPIITDEQFNITASISGASPGQNYLRVDLYKDGTDNYFGETFNGSDWYSGSDGRSYFPVTIDSSKIATATVQARIGSPSSSEYDGSGTYKMRLRRYTSGGGYTSSEASNSAVIISINLPTPSPTSQNTTATPTPTKSPSATPESFTPEPSFLLDEESSRESVLSESSESANIFSSNKPSGTQNPKKKEIILSSKENNIAKILIALGLIFIIACAILIFRVYKRRLNEDTLII